MSELLKYKQNFNKTIGLYIHIPFCKSKCYYCDFNSYAGQESMIERYFAALKTEIELLSDKLDNYIVTSIYIGGGTPSLVHESYISNLLDLCHQSFTIDSEAEISIEANPGTLSYEKLAKYRNVGINRISIGLQAWQDRLLKDIGRIHNSDQFINNYKLAKKAGFNNINVDLIFGLPGQTLEEWKETLYNVAYLEPDHLSCYSLKIEDSTVFGSKLRDGSLIPVEDELDRQMYYYSMDKLKEYGFRHYEISNFAKPGFDCKHNLVYWEIKSYLGIGAGSHSYFEDKRFNNVYGLKEYITSLDNNILPWENINSISIEEQISDYMILGLRLIRGIDMKRFSDRYGTEVLNIYEDKIERLIKKELLHIEAGMLKLTMKGLDLANQVFIEFL